ncbi:beta-propeller domain-containing protein [Actinobacillus equuli]|nr:beta-propeller domain-containing protein [Actinobacillus equuli]
MGHRSYQNNENNGILLLIAKNDRKLFIATGRGLEGALPDAIASTIIRHNITPYFKQNLYAEGIASGLSAIMAAINGEYAAYDSYGEDAGEESLEQIDGLLFFLVAGIVIFLIFRPGRNNQYISPSTADQLGRIIINSSRRRGGLVADSEADLLVASAVGLVAEAEVAVTASAVALPAVAAQAVAGKRAFQTHYKRLNFGKNLQKTS